MVHFGVGVDSLLMVGWITPSDALLLFIVASLAGTKPCAAACDVVPLSPP